MKVLIYISLFICLALQNVVLSQYYTAAQINAIEAGETALEGDMYLDTINSDYRIGLTHGKLGYLTDNQNIDSLVLDGDSILVYVESSLPKAVDVSSFFGTSVTEGDIKTGIQTIDHNGWYILDGRALGTLPAAAQTAATTLGIVGNLPNASNLVGKAKAGAEALLSTGGNATHTLTQANLPAYNLTGTTSTDGAHTHTGTVDSASNHEHSAEQQGFGLGKKGFTNSASNKDSIVIKGGTVSLYFDDNGNHIHNLNVNTAGAHTHTATISSGGSDTPFDLYQPYMVANRFIYLGQ